MVQVALVLSSGPLLHLPLLALLVALVSVCNSASVVRITALHPSIGGILGGTRLTVLGSGFDERGRSNDVYIGDERRGVFCDPIPNECHSSRIVCVTSSVAHEPQLRGHQPISVRAHGVVAACELRGAEDCTFTLTEAVVPQVHSVWPRWVAGASVPLIFRGRQFAQGDRTVANFDLSFWIGEEERCEISPGSVSWSSAKCAASTMPFAGWRKLAIQMGSSGNARLSPAASGVLVVPTIDGISPSVGSTAGGLRLTVYGTAFSRNAADVKVAVHGAPCAVLETTEEYLICFTAPHAPTAAALATRRPSETLVEAWHSSQAGGAQYLHDSISYLAPTEVRRVPQWGGYHHLPAAARKQVTTLFIPPRTGDYVFHLRATGAAELWLSSDETPVRRVKTALTDADPPFRARIATTPGSTQEFDKHVSQRSAPQPLMEGHKYWLRGVVVTGGSPAIFLNVTRVDGDKTVEVLATPEGLLPPEFTEHVEEWRPPVGVISDGVPAIVGNSCVRRGNCDFHYVASKAARVRGAVVSSLGTVTVIGAGFDRPTQFSITIAGALCPVVAGTSTQLECKPTRGLPLGTHRVWVSHHAHGLSEGFASVSVSLAVKKVAAVNGVVHMEIAGVPQSDSGLSIVFGNKPCPVFRQLSGEVRCTANPAVADGAHDVAVTAVEVEHAVARKAFVPSAAFVRPGTTKELPPPIVSPAHGTIEGGTDLEVVVPWLKESSSVSVTVGESLCPVKAVFGPVIFCRTPSGQVAGAHDVVVMASGREEKVGQFEFLSGVRTVWPNGVTTLGGGIIGFHTFDQLPLGGVDNIVVTVAGQPCPVWKTEISWKRIDCLPQPRLTPHLGPLLADLSLLDGQDTVPLTVFASPHVSVQGSAFSVPSAGGWLFSRRKFSGPVAVEVDILPFNETDNDWVFSLFVGADDQTTSWTPVYLRAVFGTKRKPVMHLHGYFSGAAATEGDTRLKGETLVRGKAARLRLEVLAGEVRGFLNGVLLWSRVRYNIASDLKRGFIGMTFSHGAKVKLFRVFSMADKAATITVNGVVIPTNGVSAYFRADDEAYSMDDVTPRRLVPGDTLFVTGTAAMMNSYGLASLWVAPRDTDPLNFMEWTDICKARTAKRNVEKANFNCTVKSIVRPGSLDARFRTVVGFSHGRVTLAIQSKLESISPKSISLGGGLVTIAGGALPLLQIGDEDAVFFSGSPCRVVTASATRLLCRLPSRASTVASSRPVLNFAAQIADDCAISIIDDIIPMIFGATETVSNIGNIIEVKGSNLGFAVVTIGGLPCELVSWHSSFVKCRIVATSGAVPTGAQPLILDVVGRGVASGDFNVSLVHGFDSVTPEIGTAGAILTLHGLGFIHPSISGVLASSQSLDAWIVRGQLSVGWPSHHLIGGLGMGIGGKGKFGFHTTLTRTFSGVAKGVILIQPELVGIDFTSTDHFVVTVGTDLYRFGRRYMHSMPRGTSDVYGTSAVYVFGSAFAVPTVGGNVTVTLGVRLQSNRWWAISKLTVKSAQQFVQNVAVGGNPCMVMMVTPTEIRCKASSDLGEGPADVKITQNGAPIHCPSCRFAVNSAAAVESVVSLGKHAGELLVWEQITQYVHQISSPGGGNELVLVKAAPGWTEGAASKQVFFGGDIDGFVGVSAFLQEGNGIGLSIGRRLSISHRGDVDFFLQCTGRYFYVVENSVTQIRAALPVSSPEEVSTKGLQRVSIRVTESRNVEYWIDDRLVFASRRAIPLGSPMRVEVVLANRGSAVSDIAPLFRVGFPTPSRDIIVVSGDFITNVIDVEPAVTLSGQPCELDYAVEGRVICVAIPPASPGSVQLSVRSALGSLSSTVEVDGSAVVSSVHPRTAACSGGTLLTVTGRGFAPDIEVRVGGELCPVMHQSPDSLVCTTPSLPSETHTVRVEQAGAPVPCVGPWFGSPAKSCPTLTADVKLDITITAILPHSIVAGGIVTVTGSGFTDLDDHVTPRIVRVRIGSTGECHVLSMSNVSIECVATALVGSAISQKLSVSVVGRGTSDVPVTVPLLVSSTPFNMGLGGGAKITIHGSGFGPAGSTATLKDNDGNTACAALAVASSAEITCTVIPGTFGKLDLAVNNDESSVNVGMLFVASLERTPTLTRVEPSSIGHGGVLTISGTHLSHTLSITVGTAACEVLSATASEIECIVNGSIATDSIPHVISLIAQDRGVALGQLNVTGLPAITSVRPLTAAAGETITVVSSVLAHGTGHGIMLGEHECGDLAVVPATASATCTVPVNLASGAAVDVHVYRTKGADTKKKSVVYSKPVHPKITKLSPASGSAVGGFLLTITGLGFSQSELENTVKLGVGYCNVLNARVDEIVCTAPRLPAPAPLASVTVHVSGRQSDPFPFAAELAVTKLATQAYLTPEGGLLASILGRGFGNNVSLVDVTVGGASCAMLDAKDTEVVCSLPPAPWILENSRRPALQQKYEKISPASAALVLRVKGVAADGDLRIDVKSAGSNSVTSVIAESEVDVWSGMSITVSGTFKESGNVVTFRRLKVDDGPVSSCALVTNTVSEIVCRATVDSVGDHYVHMEHITAGVLTHTVECPADHFLSCDASCLSDSDCVHSAWGVDGSPGSCQALADLINGEGFCQSNGGSDRVGLPFLLDSGKRFNLNCPMYNCEGGDCNAKVEIGGHSAVISTCGRDPSSARFRLVPTVTAVSPASARSFSTWGGVRLTVSGTSLSAGPSTSLFIGQTICTPLSASEFGTSIVCETAPTPDPDGGEQRLTLTRDRVRARCVGDACTGFHFDTVSTPVVQTFSPLGSKGHFAACVLGQSVTIFGTGFGTAAASVHVGSVSAAVSARAPESIVFECPSLVAGTHELRVRIAGVGSLILPDNAAVQYIPVILAVSQAEASTEGGAIVTVTGSGFTPSTKFIFTLGQALELANSTVSTSSATVILPKAPAGYHALTAKTPGHLNAKCGTAAISANCSIRLGAARTLSVNNIILDDVGVVVKANFTDLLPSDVEVRVGRMDCAFSGENMTLTTLTCLLPSELPAGEFPIAVNWKPWGFAALPENAPVVQTMLVVTGVAPTHGGRGGSQRVTVFGTGFGSRTSTINISLADVPCDPVEVSHESVVCVSRPSDAISGPVAVTVTASPVDVSYIGWSFDYMEDLTPRVHSITPTRGSTAGGTALTMIGERLLTGGVPSVLIGGLPCAVDGTETTNTTLVCSTSNAAKTIHGAEIEMQTLNGLALGDSMVFEYVDLWSRWSTWGGNPPPAFGDSIAVGLRQTVLLDVSPPRLNLVIVLGHLQVEDKSDFLLEATYVMINHGRLTLGTPENPFLHQATLRFFGDRLTPEIPVHGAKVLALRHGALDIHGKPRDKTWTLLKATVEEGAGHICVAGPIDWQEGEEIVIASTDYKMEHAEQRTIMRVEDGETSQVTIFFSEVLQHSHYGEEQCFNGNCVLEVAEVILLSRNVVIEGDSETRRLGFGATMFLMPMGEGDDRYARLSFIELRDVGQQYIVGRYPVHFHVTHSANTSYVNGTSVHRSLNRAYSIHGVNNNTYVNNVVYDTHGHSFFIEDGSEHHNIIEDNVVILSRSSTSNLNTDITPANFWIVSPVNSVRRNRAAGSMAYGFWIAPFHPHSTGPTHSKSICPSTQKLWRFDDNVAHSNGKYGLNIFQFWWPKEKECDFRGPDSQAVLRNLVSWKNKIHGVTSGHSEIGRIGSVIWDGLVSADNGEDHPDASAFWTEEIRAPNMTFGVMNSVLIATTDNKPYLRTLRGKDKNRRGINLPLGDNFFATNVTFVRYAGHNYAMEPQAWAERHSFCFPWGWEAVTRGLRFVESPNRALFRFAHHGIISDMDGSLTGAPGAQLVPKAPIFDSKQCAAFLHETLHPALVCTGSRIHRFGVSPVSDVNRDQLWRVDGRKETVIAIKGKYSVTAPMGHDVTIDFNGVKVPDEWAWKMDTRFTQPGDCTIFRVRYPSKIPILTTKLDGKEVEMSKKPISAGGAKNSTFFYDVDKGEFAGVLAHPTKMITVIGAACGPRGCPTVPVAPPRVDRPCTPFNLDGSWMSRTLPSSGSDLHVQFNDSVCLDRANGIYAFQSLLLEGTLALSDVHCPMSGGDIVFRVQRHIHIRGGALRIGTPAAALSKCRVAFEVGLPDYTQSTAEHYIHPWGMRAIVVESGVVAVFGARPETPFVRLTKDADAGATTISVDGSLIGWKVGDSIAIAGTVRLPYQTGATARSKTLGADQTEENTITSIDGSTLSLQKPLKFPHEGGPKLVASSQYAVGAEVACLTRRVSFGGGHSTGDPPLKEWGLMLAIGCTEKVNPGCGSGMNGSAMSMLKTGDVRIDGAVFEDFGQAGSRRSGVEVDGLIGPKDYKTAAGSFVTHSVFLRSLNSVVSIRSTTRNFRVSGNVVHRYRGDAVRVGGPGNQIIGNIALESAAASPTCGDAYRFLGTGMDCLGGAFRIANGNTVVRNVAAGGTVAGFAIEGEPCGSTNDVSGNVAHGMRDGVLVRDVNDEPDYVWVKTNWTGKCRKVSGFLVHAISDIGIAAWYVEGDLVIENVAIVDATIGVSPVLFSASQQDDAKQHFTLRDSTIAARWPGRSCKGAHKFRCRSTKVDSGHWCSALLGARQLHSVGVMEAVFQFGAYTGRTLGQHFFLWNEPDSYSPLQAAVVIERVSFDNFIGAEKPGGECGGLHSVAFHQNPYSNDTFHVHTFREITWGSGMTLAGRLLTHATYGDIPGHDTLGVQSTWLDFDNPKHGATWPDAPNKLWILDDDGSFTGGTGRTHVVASQTLVREADFKAIGYDGAALRNPVSLGAVRSGCSEVDDWNAFICTLPHFFTLAVEHLGENKLTRRVGPVVLCHGDGTVGEDGEPKCQGGHVQFASGPVMKGRRQRVVLERLPRFWFRVEHQGNYTLLFRGQPPAIMRLRLLDGEYLALPQPAGLTVNIRYFGINAQSRVAVYADGKRMPLEVSYSPPWEAKPTPIQWPSASASPGTNYFNKDINNGSQINVLSVSLRAGSVVELRQEPIVALNIGVAVSESQFFNRLDAFIASLASVLGIPVSRMHVVDVVAGSRRRAGAVMGVMVKAEIDSDPAIIDSQSQGMDIEERREQAADELAQVVLRVESMPSQLNVDGDTFEVSEVAATLIAVARVRPPVLVAEATSYLLVLARPPPQSEFSSPEIAAHAAGRIRKVKRKTALLRDTAPDDVFVSNVWKINVSESYQARDTQFTIAVSYFNGSSLHSLAAIQALLIDTSLLLPTEYLLISVQEFLVFPPVEQPGSDFGALLGAAFAAGFAGVLIISLAAGLTWYFLCRRRKGARVPAQAESCQIASKYRHEDGE